VYDPGRSSSAEDRDVIQTDTVHGAWRMVHGAWRMAGWKKGNEKRDIKEPRGGPNDPRVTDGEVKQTIRTTLDYSPGVVQVFGRSKRICHIRHRRTGSSPHRRLTNQKSTMVPERQVLNEDPRPLICHRPVGVAIVMGKQNTGEAYTLVPLH
jgi:hypothetical protein